MKVKQEVRELFPTPLWVLDLSAADAAAFNARLKPEIEKIIAAAGRAVGQQLADAA